MSWQTRNWSRTIQLRKRRCEHLAAASSTSLFSSVSWNCGSFSSGLAGWGLFALTTLERKAIGHCWCPVLCSDCQLPEREQIFADALIYHALLQMVPRQLRWRRTSLLLSLLVMLLSSLHRGARAQVGAQCLQTMHIFISAFHALRPA